MLILRSICLVLVILGSSHSYHVNDNWKNNKDKNLEMTLKRQQRSVTSILDYTLGAISLTGVRVAYYLEQIWFDKFGDEQKEAREELDRVIASHEDILENLQKESKQEQKVLNEMIAKSRKELQSITAGLDSNVTIALSRLRKDPQSYLHNLS